MFTITLTREQLYELYYEGPEATIHFIEGLLEELADQEQILGQRQQRIIDAQHERNERQAVQLKRVKEKLERQICLNYQLTRRLQELETELERHERGEVRRDSHNSGLPPALDPPGRQGAERRAAHAQPAPPDRQACGRAARPPRHHARAGGAAGPGGHPRPSELPPVRSGSV